VDVSSRLPALIRRPGLHTWKPSVDKAIDTSFASYRSFMDNLPDEKRGDSKMLESHWPPDKEAELHLERWYVATLSILLG
jgi:multisite-specific tRNA:(cytosine-C5)-methyltransferase